MHHTINCAELGVDVAGDALAEILEDAGPDAHVVDIIPAGRSSYDIKLPGETVIPGAGGRKVIRGNTAEVYTPRGGIVYDGLESGGNKGNLVLDHLRTEGGPFGLNLVNANFLEVTGWVGAHHEQPITFENSGADGWSEHNLLQGRIVNCGRGLVYANRPGSRPSFKGQQVRLEVSGTPQAIVTGPLSNLYTCDIEVFCWARPAPDSLDAAFCFHGNVHGSRFRLGIEKPAPLALFVADKRSSYDGSSLAKQAEFRLHTVHPIGAGGLEAIAVFPGLAEDLPAYHFTHGNPHNRNALRTQWDCANIAVMAHRSP